MNGTTDLESWLELVSNEQWLWYIKYIAANDTYLKSNVHQGGPYISKTLLRGAFPQLTARSGREENPDVVIPVSVDSHVYERNIRVVWYNSRVLKGQKNGRDEARMTQWGGPDAPLLHPNATGSLTIFAYYRNAGEDPEGCRIWMCRSVEEEDFVLDRFGPVEPGLGTIYSPSGLPYPEPPKPKDIGCALSESEIDRAWLTLFPTGEKIVDLSVLHLPFVRKFDADTRLLKRRNCEYEIFRSIESLAVLPRIQEGFATVDLFVEFANAVTNRRKSRSGKSLELQIKKIFDEDRVAYSWGEPTEGKRTPDFIFPSIKHYHDDGWSRTRLRMLAVKTTCKDRWRQVTTEASRIRVKHLLTLQSGVSPDQFREMQEEEVTLVVPRGIHDQYPEEVRPHLLSIEQFVSEVKSIPQ